MLFCDVLDLLEPAFRVICALLCRIIYPLIATMYEIFVNISKLNITDVLEVKLIYQRVTLMLTIIMVFYVAFEVVRYVVQPDKITDKEAGASNIVKKMIIVVLLIAFVPQIFKLAYDIQTRIINSNLISRIILGTKQDYNTNLGNNFSANVLSQFYYYPGTEDDKVECDGPYCYDLVTTNMSDLILSAKIPNFVTGINAQSDSFSGYSIHYDALFSVLVGGILCWMLLLYCVDIGTRWVQLIFLQIIAPIPIIGYLAPKKDNMFSKWVKQCVSVYISLFIRIAIIYFVLLISYILAKALNGSGISNIFGGISGASDVMKRYVYIFLILGLFTFARRIPKMLEEIFPKLGGVTGNLGLKPGERFKGVGRVVGFGAGAAVGAAAGIGTGIAQGARRRQAAKDKGRKPFGQAMAGIAGGAAGAVRGAIGGTVRGAANGVKKGNVVKNSLAGAKKQVESNKQFGNRQENGYTLGHQISDRARSAFGGKSRTEELESEKAPYDRRAKERKAGQDYVNKKGEDAFKEATTKNKGDKRVRLAVANYNKADQRIKDLEEADSEARKEYRAGQVKHDKKSVSEYNKALSARNSALASLNKDAIMSGIDEATLGVDKEKFKKKTNFVDPNTGRRMTAYSYDNEAYKAELNKEKERKAQELYDQRKAQIDSQFRNSVQNYVYQTDDEAERARLREIDDRLKERKKYKDEIKYAYVDWATEKVKNADGSYKRDEKGNYIYVDEDRDATFVRDEKANYQRQDLYNRNASTSQQINYEAELTNMKHILENEKYEDYAKKVAANLNVDYDSLDDTGKASFKQANSATINDLQTEDAARKVAAMYDIDYDSLDDASKAQFKQINANEIAKAREVSVAEVEDQWNKRTVGNDVATTEATIRDLTAQQEKIKDEVSGSGIGEGKK